MQTPHSRSHGRSSASAGCQGISKACMENGAVCLLTSLHPENDIELAQAVAEIARLKAVIQQQAGLIQQHEFQLVSAIQHARDEVINIALKAHAGMAAAAVEQARVEGVAKGVQIGQAGLQSAVAKAQEEARAVAESATKVGFERSRKTAFEEGKAEGRNPAREAAAGASRSQKGSRKNPATIGCIPGALYQAEKGV